MPYLAKCKRCGWLTSALTHNGLVVMEKEHDQESHHYEDYEVEDYATTLKGYVARHRPKEHFASWTETIITTADYNALLFAMRSSRFWRVLRTNPAII